MQSTPDNHRQVCTSARNEVLILRKQNQGESSGAWTDLTLAVTSMSSLAAGRARIKQMNNCQTKIFRVWQEACKSLRWARKSRLGKDYSDSSRPLCLNNLGSHGVLSFLISLRGRHLRPQQPTGKQEKLHVW